jgi:hypothetical protein
VRTRSGECHADEVEDHGEEESLAVCHSWNCGRDDRVLRLRWMSSVRRVIVVKFGKRLNRSMKRFVSGSEKLIVGNEELGGFTSRRALTDNGSVRGYDR